MTIDDHVFNYVLTLASSQRANRPLPITSKFRDTAVVAGKWQLLTTQTGISPKEAGTDFANHFKAQGFDPALRLEHSWGRNAVVIGNPP